MLGFYMNIGEYEQIEIEELIHRWQPFLPAARIAYALRYRRQKDQIRSLAAGVLLHAALLEGGIPRDEISELLAKLTWGTPGKPQFPGGKPFFNLSHSGDYVACVVGESPCGVDVQTGEREVDFLQYFFSTAEWEWICCDKDRRAIRLWTIKESLGKCMGIGISESLPDISTALSEEECLNFSLFDAQNDRVFWIQEWDFGANYRVSVCVEEYPDSVAHKNRKGDIIEKWQRIPEKLLT